MTAASAIKTVRDTETFQAIVDPYGPAAKTILENLEALARK
jgi:hypothetical protein